MSNFIDKKYINSLISKDIKPTTEQLDTILEKAKSLKGLSHDEVALLIAADSSYTDKLLAAAGEVKQRLYKNRVVLFAPLYISNYCKNECSYCGYKHSNKFERHILDKGAIEAEVQALERLGHKRLALEVGEDLENCSFEYILEAIDTIYASGDIRRINVNLAATTIENYKKLHEKEIGTYILFQETYDEDAFRFYHKGPKGDYVRQLLAHHRAMQAGIEDVGGGVLFGLSDWQFEVIALMIHNEDLEDKFGVGFHTVSVPRLKDAINVDANTYENLVDDATFEKIVAIIRLAIPYTGIILSTREPERIRTKLINSGVSQISAGSKPGVGAYKDAEDNEQKMEQQFELSDERSPLEIIKALIKQGYLPSYCTACYRTGRVGRDFMDIVKAGKIGDICVPNALMTLAEFIEEYGDDELREIGYKFISKEISELDSKMQNALNDSISRIKSGERDLFV